MSISPNTKKKIYKKSTAYRSLSLAQKIGMHIKSVEKNIYHIIIYNIT